MQEFLFRERVCLSASPAARLLLSTFGLLTLELTFIRWLASQMRLFACFSNLVLIAAFLGMGLSLGIAKKRDALRHWVLPAMFLLSIPAAASDMLGLTQLTFTDISVHLWGAELALGADASGISEASTLGGRVLTVFILFWAVAGLLVLADVSGGHYFDQLRTLKAYGMDPFGFLLGLLAVTAVTSLGTAPRPPSLVLRGGFAVPLLSPRLINRLLLSLLVLWALPVGVLNTLPSLGRGCSADYSWGCR
jgi:hypothetical protein